MISINQDQLRAMERGMGRSALRLRLGIVDAVARGTFETRNLLAAHLSGDGGDNPFWGKESPEGPFLGVRTGDTRRSIGAGRVFIDGDTVTGTVGSGSRHLAFLEHGGTIKPTSGKYLRVPTRFALTGAGVDRNAGRSARDIPGSFIFRSKAGNLFIGVNAAGVIRQHARRAAMKRAGARGDFFDVGVLGGAPGTTQKVAREHRAGPFEESPVPLYLLVEEVHEPPKLIFQAVQRAMSPRIRQLLGDSARVWIANVREAA